MVLACFLLYCFFYAITKQGPWSVFESRGAEPKGGGLKRLKMTNAWSFLQFCTRVLRTEV